MRISNESGTTMKTLKEQYNEKLKDDTLFKYFSKEGYRVFYAKESYNILPYYFYYQGRNRKKLDIERPSKKDQVICPECKTDAYIKIQEADGKNTRYACKNKYKHPSKETILFKITSPILTFNLSKLIKSYYKDDDIKSIQEYKDIYSKYKKISAKHQRIEVEDDDIKYLERYLLLGISRDLIAKLFSMSTRTLRRFIKREEESKKTRFQKVCPSDLNRKKLIIHKTTLDKDPFKSIIDYSYADFTDEDYGQCELKYYNDKKINHRSKKRK